MTAPMAEIDRIERAIREHVEAHKSRERTMFTVAGVSALLGELSRLRGREEEYRKALEPFAILSRAMDELAVTGQRKLQPEAAAHMSDEEIAALVTPDGNTLLTDGRMAFGGEQLRSKSAKVTAGDFRRAARALDPATPSGVKSHE